MTDIGGEWFMGKSAKGLPQLRRTKLSMKAQERKDYVQIYIYMKLISGGVIEDSNFIGTNLNGWFLNSPPTRQTLLCFFKKSFILIKIIEQLIELPILNLNN